MTAYGVMSALLMYKLPANGIQSNEVKLKNQASDLAEYMNDQEISVLGDNYDHPDVTFTDQEWRMVTLELLDEIGDKNKRISTLTDQLNDHRDAADRAEKAMYVAQEELARCKAAMKGLMTALQAFTEDNPN